MNVSFKLIPGEDDDLIEMLRATPSGKRSRVIKDKLRGTRRVKVDLVGWTGFEEIKALIESLQQSVLSGAFIAAPMLEPAPDRLTSDAITRRTEKLKKAAW